jgi:aryl-alcohol dehydrogenase-like predicted oxidoreductase
VQLLAAQKSASITQVVLSFLMSQPFVTLPIIGPRSVAQMQDSLSAVGFTLTAAECAWLETGK